MFSQIKRGVQGAVIISISVALFLGNTTGAFAAAKLGGTCTKPGSTTKVAGKVLLCEKKNKKLIWMVLKETTKPIQPNTSSPTTNSDPKKGATPENLTSWPNPGAKYISAVPLDLTQIESISKYRSCSGHNRDGYTFDQILETNRSLKHYFYPVPEFQGTLDKVKVFAPFDGTVASINLEANKVGGRPKNGNGIGLSTPLDKSVIFQFGHIYFVRSFEIGDSVKAGALIGYAALGDKAFDFDIDLLGSRPSKEGKEILGSIFDHMTPQVLEVFATKGATPINTKETKAFRDQNPCNFDNPDLRDDRSSPLNWVQLKH